MGDVIGAKADVVQVLLLRGTSVYAAIDREDVLRGSRMVCGVVCL